MDVNCNVTRASSIFLDGLDWTTLKKTEIESGPVTCVVVVHSQTKVKHAHDKLTILERMQHCIVIVHTQHNYKQDSK
jgi:hypothetical protein